MRITAQARSSSSLKVRIPTPRVRTARLRPASFDIYIAVVRHPARCRRRGTDPCSPRADFRASPAHVLHPALKDKKLDIIYLDTTYLDVKYCFPAQELVITACAQLVRERVLEGDEGALRSVEGERHASEVKSMKGWLKDGVKKEESVEETTPGVDGDEPGSEDLKPEVKKKEKLLVMVGTYSIGKERYVRCKSYAFASPRADAFLSSRLTGSSKPSLKLSRPRSTSTTRSARFSKLRMTLSYTVSCRAILSRLASTCAGSTLSHAKL